MLNNGHYDGHADSDWLNDRKKVGQDLDGVADGIYSIALVWFSSYYGS